MKKLIFLALCAAMLCGCSSGPENARHVSVPRLKYACINGHLYISNPTSGVSVVYTPLFAADSDVPMLVKCPRGHEEINNAKVPYPE